MKKIKQVLIALICFSASAFPLVASAEIVTFNDNVPTTSYSKFDWPFISSGYHDLSWGGLVTDPAGELDVEAFGIIDGAKFNRGHSGYSNAGVSGDIVANSLGYRYLGGEDKTGYRPHASVGVFSTSTPFHLEKASFTAAWSDDLSMTVIGWANNQQQSVKEFHVNTSEPTLINFGWDNIDRVEILGTGRSLNPDYNYGDINRGHLTDFAMADLDVTVPVPEPASYAMFLVGMALFGLIINRRRARKNPVLA